MKIVFAEQAWDDYLHWQAHDALLIAQCRDHY